MMTDTSRRDAQVWAKWFWAEYFGHWLSQVRDGDAGVFDALDENGAPDVAATKSVLAQARTLFTVSHAALLSQVPALIAAANTQAAFLDRYRKAPGLYRTAANRDGSPTGDAVHEAARSYDQTFVILSLVTLNKIAPSSDTVKLIEECWTALQTHLTDPDTGLLLNDDIGANTNPAQNPHMHLYEACLQAYRMTREPLWLDRAAELRRIGLQYFMDQESGSIAEFLTPDLKPLPANDGLRRETGHQCEWAWLLLEEADLADSPDLELPAKQLLAFADTHGFAHDGPLAGAALDAVLSNGAIHEHSFLLWPQTEAIKALALRHTAGDPHVGERACALLCLMFEHWFKDRPTYINQLDPSGTTIWPEALTRLMYHVVLAMTEGARAGLWPDIPRHDST
ncbi:mannose-6-phosphate isomerase [Loktanella ponticola]|uniref:Mannose-6-phosphate isomerase n=1 Tax=Yoonia ponticola TaxID=1524255 RepID=A0A7W9BI05_9RHOB|nr:AGE family epimerase/isomerase [Yoonia ponticola]MBB5720840.1 mannose-6-phosphate isomerase [Yoonia ponticola]